MDDRDIQELIWDLGGNDEEIAEKAREKLVKIGEAAVPALIDALKDKNSGARFWAPVALGEIAKRGVDCSAAIPHLVETLKDELLLEQSAEALGKIGESAVPALIDVLKDSAMVEGAVFAMDHIADEGIDYSATIAKKGIDCSAAVTHLIEILGGESRRLRFEASGALSYIADERAVRAVPALIDALKREDDFVQINAAEALGKIGDPKAVPALIDALKDVDEGVRSEAAHTLGRIAKKTAEKGDYASALNIIKDSTEEVRKLHHDKQSRREILGILAEITQKIHDKMNTDKKKFPAKKPPKRMVKGKRRIKEH